MKHVHISVLAAVAAMMLAGCQPSATSNVAISSNANTRANTANTVNSNSASATSIDAKEPDKYQAKIDVSFEAIGESQNSVMPTISAIVARSGPDRRMEFALPGGEKVIYLDTADKNYVILPGRRQYAELSRETLGFDVRRLLMPEQVVDQVKSVQGVQPVGEEMVNGRRATKYRYAARKSHKKKIRGAAPRPEMPPPVRNEREIGSGSTATHHPPAQLRFVSLYSLFDSAPRAQDPQRRPAKRQHHPRRNSCSVHIPLHAPYRRVH